MTIVSTLVFLVAQVSPPASIPAAAPPSSPRIASVPGSSVVAGITVAGRASLAVAPDRMHVTVRLFPRGVTMRDADEAAKAVATAMRSAGVADAAEVLPLLGTLGNDANIAVVGTIPKPTRDGLEATLRATLRAIPDPIAAIVGTNYSVQTQLQIDDCAAYDERLQTAVLADARTRAAHVAAAAGVTLGPIVAVNEQYATDSLGCGRATQPFGLDPYGPLEVRLDASATVTFALR